MLLTKLGWWATPSISDDMIGLADSIPPEDV